MAAFIADAQQRALDRNDTNEAKADGPWQSFAQPSPICLYGLAFAST